MAITLINTNQILDYRSPTGNFNSTGLTFLNGLNISGATSGNSGNYVNFSVQNLDINGSIRCQMLSGLVGNLVTGSGIIEFLPIPNTSGLNEHFYLNIHNSGNTFQQKFSSQDSQEGWFYFSNTVNTWQAFPAIGLNSSQVQTSLVRKIYSPTGMNVFDKYFSDLSIIYQGNQTGSVINSVQFQSPSVGFTVLHIPTLTQYFEIADSRYVFKTQRGTEYTPSGIVVSGVDLVVPQYSSTPSNLHGTGSLVGISGRLFMWDERIGATGFRAATPITGMAVTTGEGIVAEKIIFSGNGQIQTSVQNGNTIVISGGGVNLFALSSQPFKQGSIIFTGGSNVTLSSGNSTSGTIITIASSAAGGGGAGQVTGFGVNLNSILFTGGFVMSGEGGTSVRISNLGNNISGLIVSGGAAGGGVGNVTGISVNNQQPMFTGGFTFSGRDNITVSMTNISAGISGIIVDDSYLMEQITLQIFNQIGY